MDFGANAACLPTPTAIPVDEDAAPQLTAPSNFLEIGMPTITKPTPPPRETTSCAPTATGRRVRIETLRSFLKRLREALRQLKLDATTTTGPTPLFSQWVPTSTGPALPQITDLAPGVLQWLSSYTRNDPAMVRRIHDWAKGPVFRKRLADAWKARSPTADYSELVIGVLNDAEAAGEFGAYVKSFPSRPETTASAPEIFRLTLGDAESTAAATGLAPSVTAPPKMLDFAKQVFYHASKKENETTGWRPRPKGPQWSVYPFPANGSRYGEESAVSPVEQQQDVAAVPSEEAVEQQEAGADASDESVVAEKEPAAEEKSQDSPALADFDQTDAGANPDVNADINADADADADADDVGVDVNAETDANADADDADADDADEAGTINVPFHNGSVSAPPRLPLPSTLQVQAQRLVPQWQLFSDPSCLPSSSKGMLRCLLVSSRDQPITPFEVSKDINPIIIIKLSS
ncbi:hypothetical protein PT974_08167 [Cladobotryum mycophilum]|uniref:Uncharacterized protein n=1 Tax=Cladobotryum mycophilum TaxID=491253 RepID=A0ABR0SCM5_9HYPO